MEAKQKAIQAAYGDAWEKVKDCIDDNGWISVIKLHNAGIIINAAEFEYKPGSYRPRYLSGLETNNGWISCEDRLPDEGLKVWIVINGHVQDRPTHLHEIRIQPQFGNTVTHWKLFEEVKPPIY